MYQLIWAAQWRSGSTVASQQEGTRIESHHARTFLCGVCIVLPVPAWVSSGYSGFPHHQKDMQCMNVNEYRLLCMIVVSTLNEQAAPPHGSQPPLVWEEYVYVND